MGVARSSSPLLRDLVGAVNEEVFLGRLWYFHGVGTMKKFLAVMGSSLASVAAFADGGYTANSGSLTLGANAVTGTGGVLDTIASYITQVVDAAWPFILGIVGVGLLIWLGRAILRAVRAYFSTAM